MCTSRPWQSRPRLQANLAASGYNTMPQPEVAPEAQRLQSTVRSFRSQSDSSVRCRHRGAMHRNILQGRSVNRTLQHIWYVYMYMCMYKSKYM